MKTNLHLVTVVCFKDEVKILGWFFSGNMYLIFYIHLILIALFDENNDKKTVHTGLIK